MKTETKRLLTAVAAVTATLSACAWIYFTQIRVVQHNIGLHRRVGQVLAEQTAGAIGKQGRVVTISIETKEWPELKTQIDAFKSALKELGDYDVREYELDTKDQPKYGVGTGLSGRRYVRTVKKNEHADVFVSFVGAPKLAAEEIAELDRKPRLIAEARSTDCLPKLFEEQLITVAVVSRFQFPSPGKETPKTPEEWFAKRYQVVTPETAKTLPSPRPE
jgi:hypothetical protein